MKAHGFDMRGEFKGDRVPTLPSQGSAFGNEGREIYVEDEKKRYYSDGSSWVDYSIAESATQTDAYIANWSFKNLMPDNGRFAGDIGKNLYATSYSNSAFFNSYNSSSFSSAGEFIHNNNDYGGSAGSMTQTVIDLVETMGRNATDKRYGAEFFISQIDAGSGTASGTTFPGGTRYLMFTNSSRAMFGNYGYCTFCGWLRAITGSIGLRAAAYHLFQIDGVNQSLSNYDLSPDDDWVFVLIARRDAIGYNTAFPYFYGNNGNSLQVALPALFNGYVKDVQYTSPLVSQL